MPSRQCLLQSSTHHSQQCTEDCIRRLGASPPLPSPFPPIPASYDSDLFLLYFPSIGMKWLEMKGGFDGYQQTVDYLLSQLP